MTTKMTPAEWDRQFARQAEWTGPMRSHLYRRANLLQAERVLDVGSGTGVITAELAARTRGQVTGIDLDPDMVAYASRHYPQAQYRTADAHDLPFPDAYFDVVTCHFLLLWCGDPARCAAEMVRVTRPGGAVIVAAEPDYGGRIDYPALPLREWQIQALEEEGADPCVGRRLRALFALPAVRETEVGVMPGVWDLGRLRAEDDAEWALWARTLAGQVPTPEMEQVRASSRTATESGTRLVFMPVFYALVRV
ncbi:MAG: class I SAM-dependent methyltransferase [Anaerolineae bacterium]|nr:class I SAM-dependent methyltransferase [Anaerolineae bacterium]